MGTSINSEKIRPTEDQIGTFSDLDGQEIKTGQTEKESERKQVGLGERFGDNKCDIARTNGTILSRPKSGWTNGTRQQWSIGDKT